MRTKQPRPHRPLVGGGTLAGVSKVGPGPGFPTASEEAQFRLAAVVESSDDAIITKTLDGRITSWNQAAEKMFGYTAAEAIGQHITMLMAADRVDEEPAIIERLKRGQRIEHYETVRRHKDNTLVEISLTVSPIKDAFGRIIGASKIARDITGRKEAEEARFRLAAIVESSDDAIISKTLDGRITSWNTGAERLFGYTSAEIVGQHITILFPFDRVQEEENVLAHIRRGERLDHFETVRKTKDGRLVDISLTVSPIKDRQGKVIGASKIARDITDRKRTEARLRKLNEELESSVQERTASLRETTEQLETFCYTIAHDLRSPLRAQESFAQLLLDEFKESLGDTGQDYATRILKSAQRLDLLVNDLLAYARLTRGDLQFQPLTLAKVVGEVIESDQEQIQKHNASVTIGDLHSVSAHEPTLNLVIANLLGNALKFVKPGEFPRVRIHSESKGEAVRLWVEDDGIGLSPENIEKIFGVFQRLHPLHRYPGTGIGLAIVQKGIERMGGKVGVESGPGHGSRFWIELPAAIN